VNVCQGGVKVWERVAVALMILAALVATVVVVAWFATLTLRAIFMRIVAVTSSAERCANFINSSLSFRIRFT